MLEKLRVYFWILRNYPLYKYRCWRTKNERNRLRIYSSVETVQEVIRSSCSVARFGDGELQMISHYLIGGDEQSFNVDTFQNYNKDLGRRLYEVLTSDTKGLLLCLPYQLHNSTISDTYGELFWDREWLLRKDFLAECALDRELGDTNFTRFYMGRKDIKDYTSYINNLRGIWSGRSILIVEGEFSRLGVGNDLFDSSSSIQRIICPKTNAFARYDEILSSVKSHLSQMDNPLVILALGHTATVMAYDLTLLGYQALDLGHIDIEYEWYRMGAKKKVSVPGKYVNEVQEGRIDKAEEINNKYQCEVVARIL